MRNMRGIKNEKYFFGFIDRFFGWNAGFDLCHNGVTDDNTSDITYTATANGDTATTAIDFVFSAAKTVEVIKGSIDSVTWTSITDNPFFVSNTSIYVIAYGNGAFAAVGRYGKMAYSSDY